MPVAQIRTLVIILAGGAGGRLELLTHSRAKAAVPFAGTHRLIDFPLSNCRNAQISDVWVSQQFNPVSLSDHLSNGRPWDLDRTAGGLLLLHPREGNEDRTGFQRGTADALWRNAGLIRQFAPEALVVVSADAVYRLDYGAVVNEHAEAGQAVSMVTTTVDPDDAGRYGVVQAAGGAVRDYVYKPETPEGNLISNEVYVLRPAPVLDALDELAEQAGEEGLDDLGHKLLPRLVDAGEVREHRFDGYWRDVGTISAYWTCHQELVGEDAPIDLDDPSWPILTQATTHRASAQLVARASVKSSLIAPGSRIAGTVHNSVVGRGARVEADAVVRDAVLLPGSIVRAGATVERAILDDGVEVRGDASVGEPDGEIALVGKRAVVEPGDRLAGGARFPDDD
jgi:glucose-1-phosphate adenylyltransferase